MVGDIGSDVEAARGAGATGVLVPTPQTRPEEVAAADRVAPRPRGRGLGGSSGGAGDPPPRRPARQHR
ncbi:HAD hydrolase-like protein [Nocardioides sp. TF02-7]|uniref:HAD hydrolase-like protein n=1 Tax=Nocardioides sp. TF02-7 TaxID=2917724 RepID=UPI001F050B9E|nr:HAD hydrolase-like protein [Nocardioides sp. TF02-7]UMG93654.1 HAD hydrolase-like protein [Nocardioides sp. TF02-7]